jgi:choline dehydrogenase-like flavoprotein
VAGLALAARLSEWSTVTVLVIEAGGDGEDVQQQIDIPGELRERWEVPLVPRRQVLREGREGIVPGEPVGDRQHLPGGERTRSRVVIPRRRGDVTSNGGDHADH